MNHEWKIQSIMAMMIFQIRFIVILPLCVDVYIIHSAKCCISLKVIRILMSNIEQYSKIQKAKKKLVEISSYGKK